MQNIYTQLATFAGAPIALSFQDGSGRAVTRLKRLIIEPATGNTHDCYIQAAGVATGGSGSTLGTIRVLAKPPAANSGTIVDLFDIADQHGDGIDALAFQVDGTSGEHCRITAFA